MGDSVVKNVLKNLCCSYGWCYSVFWSFNQQNAIFLNMQDAYFEEKIRDLIEKLSLQVHMLGEGIIGKVAFTKNHQWMCLENHNRLQNSSNSISDMFLDGSDFDSQFSCGIKTIAAISVQPQGVVQFGSTKKIIETVEFVNQTKRMFEETMKHSMFEDAYITSCIHNSMGPTCSSDCAMQSSILSSNYQPMLLDHNLFDNLLHPNNLQSKRHESWNWFPTESNGQDLFDPLQDFGIPDDFDISQWIQHSSDQIQESIFKNLEEIQDNLMPVVDKSQLIFHDQKSNNQVGIDSIPTGSTKGLFSKLQINELLEGISGISHDVSSTAKRRKTENSIPDTSLLQTVLHEPGLWMANGYGMNCVNTGSQYKNRVDPPKTAKKKAKPGTRPRPKDRQQILDRMAELRELIPDGNKMSIDSLLDRTVKHVIFLQSVTKHVDRIKHADESKKNKDNDATWAYELANQTMACPLIVKDLNTPGQMLIEMSCEERGFVLEMVDIIRGFGVIILKGVMEVRDKIWARFIVESEAKQHVTRHEIFSALVQFLQATCVYDNRVYNNIMEENKKLILDGYQQSLMQLPVQAYQKQTINL